MNKYTPPEYDDLSISVYVNANGMLMHILLSSLSIDGVFEWDGNLDFFCKFDSDADDLFNY